MSKLGIPVRSVTNFRLSWSRKHRKGLYWEWVTPDFILYFGVGEDCYSREQLKGVDKAVVVGIPHHKRGFPCLENVLEFCEVDTEIITDGFEGCEVVSQFGEFD